MTLSKSEWKVSMFFRWFLTATLLCLLSARGDYFRYLDLTPSMDILPRGSVAESIAVDIRCFQLTQAGDSLIVRGFNRGEPFPVFGLSPEITIEWKDSTEVWKMDGFTYRIALDARGRPQLLSRLDSSGELLPGPDGGAHVLWQWHTDSTVTVFSLDTLQRPVQIKLKPIYSSTAARLNEYSELVYFSFGSRVASGLYYELDNRGRTLLKRAVDVYGDTVVSTDGAAEVRFCYDSAGNTVSTAWYDPSGDLIPGDYSLPREGNWDFDENGLVVNDVSIAFVLREYDENCLYISEQNIGIDGEPVQDPDGRAVTLLTRDIHGGITESIWFDLGGHRVEIAGVWATRRVYDRRGRVLETSTWNAEDEITEFPGGFALTRFSYTDSGQTEMISYYDEDNLPVINTSLGCHARSYSFGEEGFLVELRYLDCEYNLLNNSAGYAREVYVNDVNGIPVDEFYFDMNGERLED